MIWYLLFFTLESMGESMFDLYGNKEKGKKSERQAGHIPVTREGDSHEPILHFMACSFTFDIVT